ncbi:hypothetical protein VHARVF571_480016 [Vibrio harveyi]|nr:hypothetical protein VHARVF571_480016 [Vibrio harveyi]CAH1569145.1 hypothetical protein THOD03_40043 [Vibrio harveyi]
MIKFYTQSKSLIIAANLRQSGKVTLPP